MGSCQKQEVGGVAEMGEMSRNVQTSNCKISYVDIMYQQ